MDMAISTGEEEEDGNHDFLEALTAVANIVSWYCGMLLLLVILLGTLRALDDHQECTSIVAVRRSGGRSSRWLCDEVYVVGRGETLHTISDKCGDPFIVERNPHIQDPDDVFPGQVMQIKPLNKGA